MELVMATARPGPPDIRGTPGKVLNAQVRTLRLMALNEVTTGRFKDQIGSHGRTFLAQLRYELIEEPSAELRKIELSTPCSDGGKSAIANAAMSNSIQSLYLMALQQANAAPAAPMKTIEHKPFDWD